MFFAVATVVFVDVQTEFHRIIRNYIHSTSPYKISHAHIQFLLVLTIKAEDRENCTLLSSSCSIIYKILCNKKVVQFCNLLRQ